MSRSSATGMVGLLLSLFSASCNSRRDHSFPPWRMSPLDMQGAWEQSSLVLVGELAHLQQVGDQENKQLPRSTAAQARRIYWCEADFITTAVIKGSRPPNKAKWLWGSMLPGCEVAPGLPRPGGTVTKVWFLREDSAYLRPVADSRAFMVWICRAKWNNDPGVDPIAQFASLLLTPEANSTSVDYFVQSFFGAASTACEVAGPNICIPQLRRLGASDHIGVSQAACNYLRSQFQDPCIR